jgi:hypothetical protein
MPGVAARCPLLFLGQGIALKPNQNDMTIIKRAQVLREMEIKETPYGKQVTFSIKFEKKNGELVFFPRAVSAGLRFGMKENRFRGVVPVDADGNATSHVYPVHIDNIHEYNGMTVKL